MDLSGLPESMRSRIEARNALPPLDRTREFLSAHVQDTGGLDEVLADLRHAAGFNTYNLHRDLAALEAVVTEEHPPGTLSRLVGWDANWVLDDPSDEGAAQFLRDLADMVRQVLSEHE